MTRSTWLFGILLLGGCAVTTVPDQTWHRLPPPPAVTKATVALDMPVVVTGFDADGIYADQALVYALDPDSRQVRQYHYQLWVDPPVRILQRRLVERLRQAALADVVTDELPASVPALRIKGTILRFDRAPLAEGGVAAMVTLRFRVDAPDHPLLLDRIHRIETPAEDGSIGAFSEALAAGVDEAFAVLQADLEHAAGALHAR